MKTRSPTESDVNRWIRLGFGQEVGAAYKPFVWVRDVASPRRSHMIASALTGRVHHYFDELEGELHTLLEYRGDVVDIKEGFAALPWSETQDIARALSVHHPAYGNRTPRVLTTVMVKLNRPDGVERVAIRIASGKQPTDVASLHELLILRIFWGRRGIKFFVPTDRTLPRRRAQNLSNFYGGVLNQAVDQALVSVEEFAAEFAAHWSPSLPHKTLMQKLCKRLGLTEEVAAALLGRGIWRRLIEIDLDAPISPLVPLSLHGGACRVPAV